MTEFKLSDVRRDENRCVSFKREGTRTWRCQLVVDHDSNHVSLSGHRHWTDSEQEGRTGK